MQGIQYLPYKAGKLVKTSLSKNHPGDVFQALKDEFGNNNLGEIGLAYLAVCNWIQASDRVVFDSD